MPCEKITGHTVEIFPEGVKKLPANKVLNKELKGIKMGCFFFEKINTHTMC